MISIVKKVLMLSAPVMILGATTEASADYKQCVHFSKMRMSTVTNPVTLQKCLDACDVSNTSNLNQGQISFMEALYNTCSAQLQKSSQGSANAAPSGGPVGGGLAGAKKPVKAAEGMPSGEADAKAALGGNYGSPKPGSTPSVLGGNYGASKSGIDSSEENDRIKTLEEQVKEWREKAEIAERERLKEALAKEALAGDDFDDDVTEDHSSRVRIEFPDEEASTALVPYKKPPTVDSKYPIIEDLDEVEGLGGLGEIKSLEGPVAKSEDKALAVRPDQPRMRMSDSAKAMTKDFSKPDPMMDKLNREYMKKMESKAIAKAAEEARKAEEAREDAKKGDK